MDPSVHRAIDARAAATLLAGGPFAATLAHDGALVIATDQPPRVAFATGSGLAMFGAADLDGLEQVVFGARSPGARRMRQLLQSLPLGGSPRLEQLRFFVGRTPVLLGLSCARLAGPDGSSFLVAGAVGAADVESTAGKSGAETPPAIPDPVSPPSVPPPPFVPPPLDGPIRFLWSLDAEDRFGPTDPALATRVGSHAPRPGETL